jgi:hypothetical protein
LIRLSGETCAFQSITPAPGPQTPCSQEANGDRIPKVLLNCNH